LASFKGLFHFDFDHDCSRKCRRTKPWDEPPISSDSEMHAPAIVAELSAMKPAENAYLKPPPMP
jgi:hypothetical protein